jgi:hypothetical protein
MELQGIEHNSNESAIAPIGGKLPYSLELQSSKILDILLTLLPTQKNTAVALSMWDSKSLI